MSHTTNRTARNILLAFAVGAAVVSLGRAANAQAEYTFGADLKGGTDLVDEFIVDGNAHNAAKAFDLKMLGFHKDIITFEDEAVTNHQGGLSVGTVFGNVSFTGDNTAGGTKARGAVDDINIMQKPDVLVDLPNTDNDSAHIYGTDHKDGFDTTFNGDGKFLRVDGPDLSVSTLTINFEAASNVTGFGGYFSGLGTTTGLVTVGGTADPQQPIEFNFTQTIKDMEANSNGTLSRFNGSLAFFGLNMKLTENQYIKSITFTLDPSTDGAAGDVFAMDDLVLFGTNRLDPQNPYTPVPEPAFYQMGALLALGTLGLVRAGRRRRSGTPA